MIKRQNITPIGKILIGGFRGENSPQTMDESLEYTLLASQNGTIVLDIYETYSDFYKPSRNVDRHSYYEISAASLIECLKDKGTKIELKLE